MGARKKKTVISGVTREAADNAFAAFAKADASINKINADIELQCAKIREKRQAELTQLTQQRDQAFDTLQAFATENQTELFSKKKSLDMAHGTIGFRTGTPKLKILKGFTWESAKTLVKTFLPDYIRTSEEIAKDKLLADRDLEQVEFVESDITKKSVPMSQAMSECGILVVQEETFYVEPKKEEVDQ
jgi:phage host-nuclease inhibitor protein Gam